MKKIFLPVLLMAAFLVMPVRSYCLEDSAGEIILYMGEARSISVSNPTRIVIGNPGIADITDVSKNEMTIASKSPGTTTLVFWDNYGEQSCKIKILAENLKEIKLRIDNLLGKLNLPEVYSQAEEDEGKVLLLGRVKTPQDKERIITILGSLKEKVVDLIQVREEQAVIDIDVQVMELTKGATNTLGLTWPDTLTLTEAGSPGILAAGVKWSTLFKVLNLNRAAFSFTLEALVQEGKAQILSRPRLACQSGKEAELSVGGEKPVFTTQVASTGGSGTSVEYKDYGIKLKIKPALTEDNRVKLSVNVEVSEVGTAETIGTSGGSSGNTTTAKAYPILKRAASTELYVDSGQTMVIGGLTKKKEEEDIRKTPGLGSLPIIGAAFRKKVSKTGGGNAEKGDTELFITLTPTVSAEGQTSQAKKEADSSVPQPTQAVIEEKSVDPVTGYARIIQERILANFTYPREIKESGYQGTVKLRLHIYYTGKLMDVSVKDPSGYQPLDDQAVSMVKSTSLYPPFPASIEDKELWIDIPIVFQLK